MEGTSDINIDGQEPAEFTEKSSTTCEHLV
jgi:hypothetical protein